MGLRENGVTGWIKNRLQVDTLSKILWAVKILLTLRKAAEAEGSSMKSPELLAACGSACGYL